MGNCLNNNVTPFMEPIGENSTPQPLDRLVYNEYLNPYKQDGFRFNSVITPSLIQNTNNNNNQNIKMSEANLINQPFISTNSIYPNSKQSKTEHQGDHEGIDFDSIGKNFMFLSEASKMRNDLPWVRDESDNSNRPNKLIFGTLQQSKAISNTQNKGNELFESQLAELISRKKQTSSKNFTSGIDDLTREHKKQQIFYDLSTYNQNPYIKSSSDKFLATRCDSLQPSLQTIGVRQQLPISHVQNLQPIKLSTRLY